MSEVTKDISHKADVVKKAVGNNGGLVSQLTGPFCYVPENTGNNKFIIFYLSFLLQISLLTKLF